MSLTTRTLTLHLALTPGVGGRTVTRILARNTLLSRTPEDFLGLSPEAWREEYRLNQRVITHLTSEEAALKETEDLERRLDGLGVNLVTLVDAHYPAALEEFDPDPPGVLFLYGNAKLLDAKTFAVLASRRARSAELEQIETLTEAGVLNGEVLVAGHDRPEYQRAAIVPLRWGAPRILCLDRGLFQVLGEDLRSEAFRAARLWRYEFDPNTDLAISPFRPSAGFVGINNKLRDRLVAGLARRIDFVHVAENGNMTQLARMALKTGRPVRVSDRILGYREFVRIGATVFEDPSPNA